MMLKPSSEDYRIIGYYLGKITIGLGLLMAIPMVVGIIYAEFRPVVEYLLGMSMTLLAGTVLTALCHTEKDLGTRHAMCVAALSWLIAMVAGAVPLFFSGHYGCFLDACFEALNGFTTTGLTLVNDLDHMARAHNFWRHLTMFVGGQGIVVIALTFLFRGTSGAFRMYLGEARAEKILPNVVETARFIWLVSLVYLVIGATALTVSGVRGGLRPGMAFFDALCIFATAWDTGGFTPHSQSILFYHNPAFELITVCIMFLGAMNFALHYVVMTGNRRELYRNIEMRALAVSVIVTLSIVAWALTDRAVYAGAMPFFSKVFYQLASGQTSTGYSTIYPRQFVTEWGPLGMLGLTLAMAVGGSVCSTTGAIKLLRIGVLYKALRHDVKKLLVPDSAVLVQKFHHIKDITLEDRHVRMASLILISYIALYLFGAIVTMLYGYPFNEAVFESVSAAANIGFSCGITSPSMPAGLKILYMFQMWMGRLEFIAVLALLGMIIAAFRGKR